MLTMSLLALSAAPLHGLLAPSPAARSSLLRSSTAETEDVAELMDMLGLDEVAEGVPATPRVNVVMSDARVQPPESLTYDDGARDTGAADWNFALALPFSPAPKYQSFDVTLPGDAGFDPLAFADRKATLLKMRDAELKHGRLAMLAATGWPLAELWDAKLASVFGLQPELTPEGLSPSILNGGLGNVSPLYWVACLAAASAVEVVGLKKRTSDSPGDFGFDPLNLNSPRMADCEVRHSRLAMIAIVAYAFQEFASKVPVTKETPFLFENIFQFQKEWANAGFITPN